ncbi:hypothetical protein TWF281_010445 [Arthrobotrys megalospora]
MKARALVSTVDPSIARRHVEKLLEKGVEKEDAFERTATAWKNIEEELKVEEKP